MMPNETVLPLCLTAYSLPHTMGYLKTRDDASNPAPMTPLEFADLARDLGLAGVELPFAARVPSFNGEIVEAPGVPENFPDELQARNLKLVADYGALLDYDAQHTREYLDKAASMGAKVVRAILSHLLCGDRRKMPGGWNAHRNALAARLRELLPYAEDKGVVLALENHQDATSEDFIWLYEQTGKSAAFGITLDTGNPLSVGQDPTEAAIQMAPLIRHVHLKDYTMHFAPEGFRLVRCAAGEGVIDFPAILKAIRANGHDVLPGIEIAAQHTRTIPLLEPDWWEHYPTRSATTLLPVLQTLWAKGRPQEEPYSSAWERGENSETVRQEELDVVGRSVNYFRSLAVSVR